MPRTHGCFSCSNTALLAPVQPRAAASQGSGCCAGAALGRAEPLRWHGMHLPLANCPHGHSWDPRHRARRPPPCCPPCQSPEQQHVGSKPALSYFYAPPVWLPGAGAVEVRFRVPAVSTGDTPLPTRPHCPAGSGPGCSPQPPRGVSEQLAESSFLII